MRRPKTYIGKLMKNGKFRKRFDEEYQNLCDYILLNDLEFKRKLKISYREYSAGETVDIDELIR